MPAKIDIESLILLVPDTSLMTNATATLNGTTDGLQKVCEEEISTLKDFGKLHQVDRQLIVLRQRNDCAASVEFGKMRMQASNERKLKNEGLLPLAMESTSILVMTVFLHMEIEEEISLLMVSTAQCSGTTSIFHSQYNTQTLACSLADATLLHNVATRPPMGWNSWNKFACEIDEKVIKETADALISTGFSKLGYEYVNIDDCWAEYKRDKDGRLVANATTFPSGIKALADYVHSKGLKLGIYSDAGFFTCSKRQPGSLGHEQMDAETFADWGVDYLKYDNCFTDGSKPELRYPKMRDELLKTGRPIFYSLCEWGVDDPSTWGIKVGNSWRTTPDINNTWSSILNRADLNSKWAEYAGPGGWNDPDMLEVGNGNATKEEYKAHFSLWALMKAPLLIGCDVRSMSPVTMKILSNAEVIAVNQDPLGIQGKKVYKHDGLEVWAGPLSDNRIVVILFNRRELSAEITVKWEDIGLNPSEKVQVRNLWKHKNLTNPRRGSLTSPVKPHAAKMFIFTRIQK